MKNIDSSNRLISPHIREAFNKIKINIDFSAVGKETKALIITSASTAEGKTTMAINTAISMACAGGRTLLIDCDMRQPQIHKLFNIINAYGLSDIIAKNVNWGQYANDVGIDNLHIMTSGRKPPNPAELLGSQKMLSLIDEFRREYDYIIFDTPPILLVPDALALSKHVDGIILVIRYGHSKLRALQESIHSLTLANAAVLGAIINDVPNFERNYGFIYSNDYGYGYDISAGAGSKVNKAKEKLDRGKSGRSKLP